ncbi:MAG: ABC transporter substrate-binding protein [Lactobacillus sp.]|nr:ABC transporter substrate-binding protein [Lactobacillus sp.]
MKKLTVVLGVFIVVGILVWIYSPDQKETAGNKPIVKIGASIPLTGDMAFMGQALQKGMKLAVDEINANPDNAFEYQIVVMDDQMQPAKTAAAANALINVSKVNAIMSAYSTPAMVINPIAEKSKVIAFHTAFTDRASDGEYNFRNFTTSRSIDKLAIEFAEEVNAKKMLLIFQNTQAAQEVLDRMQNSLDEKGIEHETLIFNQGDRDFKIMALKAKEFNPDFIDLYGASPELELIVRELKMQGIDVPKVVQGMVNMDTSHGALEGVYVIDASEGNDEFRKKYDYQPTYYASYFYDNIYILYNAYEKIGPIAGLHLMLMRLFMKYIKIDTMKALLEK